MSEKAGSGCLSTIVVFAVLGFIGRYVPTPIILIVVGLAGAFALHKGYKKYIAEDKQRASDAIESASKAKAAAAEVEVAAAEAHIHRIKLRDADVQDAPYTYQSVGHPNATLALRFGIANQANNSSRAALTTIRLRKIQKLDDSTYIAELPDFADRKVKVIIENGSEYVKTFLPLSTSWFTIHADLELVLKDNKTFTLKELAMLHVQKTVKGI